VDPLPPIHDANGKFAKGNKAGKGNPFHHRMGKLRTAFLEAVTVLEMQAVKKAIYESAVDGDVMAQRLWLEYTTGRVLVQREEADDEAAEAMVIEPPEALKTA